MTEQIIEIQDPELDPAQIMREIRARIEKRRAELGYEQRSFPSFGVAAYPGEPTDVAYDADLHHYLRLANETYAMADTDVVLAPSPATQAPVLGRLWQMIRGGAHNLVIFYVNRAIAHQTDVNRQLVSALNRMTVVVEGQQRKIEQLQREVAALRGKTSDK
ncbi:MAG: hypothetical protein U0350_30405 [Caldilineaceae bacterium]